MPKKIFGAGWITKVFIIVKQIIPENPTDNSILPITPNLNEIVDSAANSIETTTGIRPIVNISNFNESNETITEQVKVYLDNNFNKLINPNLSNPQVVYLYLKNYFTNKDRNLNVLKLNVDIVKEIIIHPNKKIIQEENDLIMKNQGANLSIDATTGQRLWTLANGNITPDKNDTILNFRINPNSNKILNIHTDQTTLYIDKNSSALQNINVEYFKYLKINNFRFNIKTISNNKINLDINEICKLNNNKFSKVHVQLPINTLKGIMLYLKTNLTNSRYFNVDNSFNIYVDSPNIMKKNLVSTYSFKHTNRTSSNTSLKILNQADSKVLSLIISNSSFKKQLLNLKDKDYIMIDDIRFKVFMPNNLSTSLSDSITLKIDDIEKYNFNNNDLDFSLPQFKPEVECMITY